MSEREKIIVICGPTASGKTALGIRLAGFLEGEIISADSRQVYIGMDIGTSKPAFLERKGVPHHLIDVVTPDKEFNAFMFMDMAREKVREIMKRRHKTIVVGGTGLYLKALAHGLTRDIRSFPDIRRELRARMEAEGLQALYHSLKQTDPASAKRIAPRDAFRIIRALEVSLGTGIPISTFHRRHGFADSPYDILWIGLRPRPPQLHENIAARTDEMFGNGLVEEVRRLRAMGYGQDLHSMKTLGYKEVGEYLSRRMSLGEAREAVKKNTRRYAKRQMTWFRAQKDIQWYEPQEKDKIFHATMKFYDHAAAQL